MFNQAIKRIGYACKTSRISEKNKLESIPELNFKTTTVAWLNRQTTRVAEQRLEDLAVHNIQSLENVVNYLSTLEPSSRQFRIGSDCLPVYTENTWKGFWKNTDMKNYCERRFSRIGDLARKNDIRLSFHPGQFTVLASDNPDIVEKSIEEMEYHADMARWMGYGKEFQDFKINVHISGKQGPAGIKRALPRLSSEARNMITIENEEMKWGLSDTLELRNDLALVLDIHHHYINSQGEFIRPSDDRFKMVMDSWRGVRPVIHYSVSRSEYLTEVDDSTLPDYKLLLEQGHKKGKLRAHSDYFDNTACNDWALEFLEYADIMTESKAKNLSSSKLFAYAKQRGII